MTYKIYYDILYVDEVAKNQILENIFCATNESFWPIRRSAGTSPEFNEPLKYGCYILNFDCETIKQIIELLSKNKKYENK